MKAIRHRLSPATVIALIALFVALGGVGVAASGGNFILGQSNSATSQTGLAANTSAAALAVTNNVGTPLKLNAPAGVAPFAVNNGTKVANLNADTLDSLDSSYFLPKTGKAADSNKLDGLDSTEFVPASSLRRVAPVTQNILVGGNIDIGTVGPFTFRGYCAHNAGTDLIQISILSTNAHSAFASMTTSTGGTAYENGNMSAGVGYQISSVLVAGGVVNLNPVWGTAVAPGGQEVFFDLYTGVNARNKPGQCLFGGSFVVS
jgi:hypothetical protein